MPTYLEAMNQLLVEEAGRHPGLLQFGENIDKGSRLCGIAKNLAGCVVNVGNCENTHVGAGLGMMLNGGRSVLFVKQLDFLPLAADQMLNTVSLLRAAQGEELTGPGSFTIVTIVCDQGWQGPQSSLVDLPGLCSLVRWDGYTLTSLEQARRVIGRHLVRPGVRILALSQRQFGEPVRELPVLQAWNDEALVQHATGEESTVVCVGFSLEQGCELLGRLGERGKRISLFMAQPAMPHDWSPVAASATRTGRLVVFDDSKGAVSMAHKIASTVLRAAPGCRATVVTREHDLRYAVHDGRFQMPAELATC